MTTNNLPRMTRAQINARAQAKEQILLDFLASGEVWTTPPIIAGLLGLSVRRAQSQAQKMEQQGLVVTEKVELGRGVTLVGITPQGLAYSTHPRAGETSRFEPGRVSEAFIHHHIDTQRARLQAEAAGWTWEAGKLLYAKGWHKVPDALATSSTGERVAIEIERTIKTPLRYQQIIPQALRDVKSGHYDRVQYLSPQGRADAVERALRRVAVVKVSGDSVKLTDQHWARFSFANLTDWPQPGAQK